jgi:hypothetical protein
MLFDQGGGSKRALRGLSMLAEVERELVKLRLITIGCVSLAACGFFGDLLSQKMKRDG